MGVLDRVRSGPIPTRYWTTTRPRALGSCCRPVRHSPGACCNLLPRPPPLGSSLALIATSLGCGRDDVKPFIAACHHPGGVVPWPAPCAPRVAAVQNQGGRAHALLEPRSLIHSAYVGIKRPKVQAHASGCYRGCGRPLGVSALSGQLAARAVTMGARLGGDDARCSTQIDSGRDLLRSSVVQGRLRMPCPGQGGRQAAKQQSQFPRDLSTPMAWLAALPARSAKVSIGRLWSGCSSGR